jgi:hypothetical protein
MSMAGIKPQRNIVDEVTHKLRAAEALRLQRAQRS